MLGVDARVVEDVRVRILVDDPNESANVRTPVNRTMSRRTFRRDPNSEPVHNVPVSDPTRVSSSESEPPVQMSPGASSGGERADSAEGGGGYTRLPTHSYIVSTSWLRDSTFPPLSGMFSSS